MFVPSKNSSRVSLVSFAALLAALFCFFALAPRFVFAQSATSGAISGTVVDPSNAIVPGAKITLTETTTNAVSNTVTDSAGHYLFAAVQPGPYTMKVAANGFKTHVITGIIVAVAHAYTYNVTLEVGAASQTVEVTSTPGAELQTANASVGTTISGTTMLRLPTIQRQVSSLLGLQPAVTPMVTNDVMGGQVAGAASDQTTFLVDGGDATSDMEGTNSYAAIPGETEPAPFIQVPVETTQEFRVITADPTSSLNRSQGGQISIISKRGTNKLHGSAYEYYQGSALNANSWSNNRLGLARPGTVNNRFGFTLGGPVIKNKLFLYGNYEGRRFRQSTNIATDVPTASARAGVLVFPDSTGAPVFYNLGPTTQTVYGVNVPGNTNCSAGTPCDPRTIGISPTIQSYWNLMPLPNEPGTGDEFTYNGTVYGNSATYNFNVAEPDNENYGMIRLDYTINSRWNFFATWWQQKAVYYTNDQYTLIGTGAPKLISDTPILPRFGTFELTGTIGSSFTDQLHGSYMLDTWGWLRGFPTNPSGITASAVLQVSGEGRTGNGGTSKPFSDPTNYNTQNGRGRYWGGHDWYLADDATWLHGSHTITFGGSWYFWNITHVRTDNVLGGLTYAPIYWVGSRHMSSGSFVDTPASQAPTICTTSITTGCLTSGDTTRWDSEYAAMLGLVDHSSQVITANNQFIPNPPGTYAKDHVHMGSFYTYVGDSWKLKPSITLTYGVSWGVQFPPKELSGLQVLQQYASTGQPVQNINAYFAAKHAALDRGNPFPSLNDFTNPSFEFSPIGAIPGYTRPINTYWGSVGPHVAVAWQPSFSNALFGNHQTVIRAGYALEWNRTNAVGMVLTPLLGDGLMQIAGCNAPVSNGTCSGATTDATNAYRIGVDGSGPSPIAPAGQSGAPIVGYPLVPSPGLSSTYGFNLDPNMKVPYSHEFNMDIQRTFAHNWLVDVGYIGRISRNLENGGDINASDMFAKDPVSGQTLASAFSAVSRWAQAGGSCTSSTSCPGLAVQPFFENMAAPGASGPSFCTTTYGGPCTYVAAQDTGDAANGDLGSFMEFNYNFIAQAPLDPTQFVFNFWNWSGGWSNYNAGFISVRKAFSQGLDLGFNFTLSHTMGTQTLNQQYIIYANPSSLDPATGYAEEPFDRRKVFNAYFYYQLPFGKGRMFASGSNALDRVIGGWYVSGIWTWQSGFPLCIGADGTYGDIGQGANNGECALTPQVKPSLSKGGPSGLNEFSNPAAIFAGLTRPLPDTNLRPQTFDGAGFPLWNLDMSLGKNIVDTERFKAIFEADAFNVFNLMMPADSGFLDMNTSPSRFGEVTGQVSGIPGRPGGPRAMQLGLRLEW